ncbi:MAG: phosphoribosylglycinamide formyltransferase [Bacteroidota bacterium]
MFDKLQAKWKVKGWQLALILVTFAIGGSLTGWVGRKLLGLTGMEHGVLYYVLYVIVITLLWPMAVILVSIPFGQYPFFIKYIKRIGGRMVGKSHARVVEEEKELAVGQLAVGNQQPSMDDGQNKNQSQIPDPQSLTPNHTKIAVFASGGGSNAQKIIDYFKNSSRATIALIVCNKPGAGVLSIAQQEAIPSLLIDKEKFFRGNGYVDELKSLDIEFIVLAGFLWKIPIALIKNYPNKIINIHPALLPKHGGKGMYGHFVHEAVLAAGDTESGISIHYVDEQYDHGRTILQVTCPVLAGDTPDLLAKRVLALEHEHYPKLIEKWIGR